MKISVISPLYFSSADIQELYARLVNVLTKITDDYEIIFVNDGSPDDSLQKALEIFEFSNNLIIVDLSKNFGQHKAIMSGLQNCSGDIVFIIDADLEEDPSYIDVFYKEYLKDPEYDLIYGVQEVRKGGFFERISGRIFYSFFDYLVGQKKRESPTPFRLMTRKFVDSIIKFQESEFFFHGISNMTGFQQKSYPIEKKMLSNTSYSLKKKIGLLVDSITSFSNKPLKLIFYIGLLICLVSLVILFYFLFRYYTYGSTIEGWNSLILSIWLIGGITIFSIGVIGIYLSKIFLEVKNRPFTIIKNVYKK